MSTEVKYQDHHRKCIHCPQLIREKDSSWLGYCKLYDRYVRDTLCGCTEHKENGHTTKVVLHNFGYTQGGN